MTFDTHMKKMTERRGVLYLWSQGYGFLSFVLLLLAIFWVYYPSCSNHNWVGAKTVLLQCCFVAQLAEGMRKKSHNISFLSRKPIKNIGNGLNVFNPISFQEGECSLKYWSLRNRSPNNGNELHYNYASYGLVPTMFYKLKPLGNI